MGIKNASKRAILKTDCAARGPEDRVIPARLSDFFEASEGFAILPLP